MAEQTEQAARTDVSPLRSWIVRHPIATFLVLVYATTTALVFVPRALTEPGLLPGGATPHGVLGFNPIIKQTKRSAAATIATTPRCHLQLLCEQVVGRGLRRRDYEIADDGKLTEEVAKILGVPFEVTPFKKPATGRSVKPKRHHVAAIPERAAFEISFPGSMVTSSTSGTASVSTGIVSL